MHIRLMACSCHHAHAGRAGRGAALLSEDDFAQTRVAALERVSVPPHVVELLADLRAYLQVSARRTARRWGMNVLLALCVTCSRHESVIIR